MRNLLIVSVFLSVGSCTSRTDEDRKPAVPRDPASAALPFGLDLPAPPAPPAPMGPLTLMVSCREARGNPGQDVSVRVEVLRGAETTQSVELTAVNLPRGVTSEPVVVPPGATSGTLLLHVSADAPLVAHHPARVYGYAHGGTFAFARIPTNVAPTGIVGFMDRTATSPGDIPASGPAGTLDGSYAGTGFAQVQLEGRHIAPLDDGSVVIGGAVEKLCGGVTKLDSAGNVDASFGTDGTFVIDVPGFSYSEDIVSLHDGSVVVAGMAQSARGDRTMDGFVLRLTPEGMLDPAFGNGGIVRIDRDGSEEIRRLAVDSLGRILAVGNSWQPLQEVPILLTRFMPDGTLDPSFGSAGSTLLTLPGGAYASAVALDEDGAFFVAAHLPIGAKTAVVRLTEAGAIDGVFGTGGVVTIDGGGPLALAVDEQRRVLVSRYVEVGPTTGQVRRLLPNGTRDPSFGANGVVNLEGGVAWTILARDSQVTVAGAATGTNETGNVYAARLLDDGTFDPTFGEGGEALYDLPGSAGAYDATFAGGDRLYLGGMTWSEVGPEQYEFDGFVLRVWN